jgi:hypothetical protein
MTQTIDFKFTQLGTAATHYHYLPFEVPRGRRGSISLFPIRGAMASARWTSAWSTARQPTSPARRGLIGWTGAARSAFFTALDDATPGYLYGPIEPGTWKVLIGLATFPRRASREPQPSASTLRPG